MGWKGDPCYYCHANLHQILDQEQRIGDAGLDVDDPRSFEWHMAGLCMVEGYYVQMLDGAELRIQVKVDWDYG